MAVFGSTTSSTTSCKHKIFMDFTKCEANPVLNTYLPTYSDYKQNYLVQAQNLKELCITADKTNGLFFIGQGNANQYGTNVFAVNSTFTSDKTTAQFYTRDQHGGTLDHSKVEYVSLQLIGLNGQKGPGVLFVDTPKPQSVEMQGAGGNILVKFCKA